MWGPTYHVTFDFDVTHVLDIDFWSSSYLKIAVFSVMDGLFHIVVLMVNYGISNTILLEIP